MNRSGLYESLDTFTAFESNNEPYLNSYNDSKSESNTDSYNEPHDDPNSDPYIFGTLPLHICLGPVILSGCCVNALLMAAILSNAKMRVRENILHFNLACIDTLLLLVASLPMVITHVESTHARDMLKGIHCVMFASLCFTNFYSLITIAVSRVKRFTQFDYQISKRQQCLAIIGSWGLGWLGGVSRMMTTFRVPMCGSIIDNIRVLPFQLSNAINFIIYITGTAIVIVTFVQSVVFLLKLKHIHPSTIPGGTGAGSTVMYRVATEQISFTSAPRLINVTPQDGPSNLVAVLPNRLEDVSSMGEWSNTVVPIRINVAPKDGSHTEATVPPRQADIFGELPCIDDSIIPRRASVSAINLEIFQATSSGKGNLATETLSRIGGGGAQPSPHFLMRRYLVVTTFILITCSIVLLIVPMGITFSLFDRAMVFNVVYVSMTLNSCVTPVVYILRYHHFRKVIFGWLKKVEQVCSCITRVDIE